MLFHLHTHCTIYCSIGEKRAFIHGANRHLASTLYTSFSLSLVMAIQVPHAMFATALVRQLFHFVVVVTGCCCAEAEHPITMTSMVFANDDLVVAMNDVRLCPNFHSCCMPYCYHCSNSAPVVVVVVAVHSNVAALKLDDVDDVHLCGYDDGIDDNVRSYCCCRCCCYYSCRRYSYCCDGS